VARNRKRRSERRPRRPSDDAVSPGVATAKAARRDERDETPDPLEHAAPDVELAEAQLAIGRPQLPSDAFEGEEFDDDEELGAGGGGDADFGSGGGGGGSGSGGGAGSGSGGGLVPGAASTPSPRGAMRLVGFLQGSWRELQRVQWPDRRQVMQATGVVIGFVIVAGVFLGVADVIATKLVNLILK
jgi:preprotein translocase subunit SecE